MERFASEGVRAVLGRFAVPEGMRATSVIQRGIVLARRSGLRVGQLQALTLALMVVLPHEGVGGRTDSGWSIRRIDRAWPSVDVSNMVAGGSQDLEPRRSWVGHPHIALAVRVAYVVVPLLVACSVSGVLARVQALADQGQPTRWVLVLAAATVAMALTHRLLARLLPLAALLELSVVFPGQAPSRFTVARDAGNTAKLRDIVVRAQHGDPVVGPVNAEAARDILALVAALRSHDSRTRGHSERVRVFTDMIAEQLNLTGDERQRLRWAALLHDVGKLRVPTELLNKAGKLDGEEWTIVRRHPAAGTLLTAPLAGWLGEWTRTIAQHHERFDGTGYPLGMRGTKISLGARIVAVADSFEVMTAPRSYRRPMNREAALRELSRCSGTQFDPRVVRAMLAISTPRLRWAMGPLSWAGALPFLAATPAATTIVLQATAGFVLVSSVAAAPAPAAAGNTAAGISAAMLTHHQVSASTPTSQVKSPPRNPPTSAAPKIATPVPKETSVRIKSQQVPTGSAPPQSGHYKTKGDKGNEHQSNGKSKGLRNGQHGQHTGHVNRDTAQHGNGASPRHGDGRGHRNGSGD